MSQTKVLMFFKKRLPITLAKPKFGFYINGVG
jgi:hypothetical protein